MKKIGVIFIVAFFVIVGFAFWWRNGLSPVNSRDKSQQMFVVPNGAGIRAIFNDLREQGLIKTILSFSSMFGRMDSIRKFRLVISASRLLCLQNR